MNEEKFAEQSALNAVGILSEDESRDYRETRASHPDLHRLDNELRTVGAWLAASVDQVDPPASLKDRVLSALPEQRTGSASLSTSGPTERNAGMGTLLKFAPWAIAAGLAMSCGLLVQTNTQLRDEVTSLRDQGAMDSLQIAVLSSMVQDSPQARAVAVWNGERQEGMLTVEGLPPIPEDKDYQLWVIDPQYEIPVDGGVFHTDKSGAHKHTFHPDRPVTAANTFAVSLERKGGVPKAEGPMVLISMR